jgi:hypothetical protein
VSNYFLKSYQKVNLTEISARSKFNRRKSSWAHGQRGTAYSAQTLNLLLGDSDVARAEKRRLTETEVGIAKACSPKIQWSGGPSDQERLRIPAAMPASRHQRSGEDALEKRIPNAAFFAWG